MPKGNDMTRAEMLHILHSFMPIVGFAGWRISVLKYGKVDMDDNIANVEIDRLEKTLEIVLSTAHFKPLPRKVKRNVLIHELIHARVDLYQKIAKVLIDDAEEDMVNDIARGLERLNPDALCKNVLGKGRRN
jgi:hypothetical protein